MAIAVTCQCGASYNIRDEHAGKRLKCPRCGQAVQAPALAGVGAGPSAGAPAAPGAPGAPGMPPPLPARAQPPSLQPGLAPDWDGRAGAPAAEPGTYDVAASAPPAGAPVRAPAPLSYAAPPVYASGDPFARNKFLLRQKLVSINQKYHAWDEVGNTLLFIERPAHVMQNLGALLAGIVVALVVGVPLAVGAVAVMDGNETAQIILAAAGGLLGLTAGVLVGVALSALRHVTFYRDDTKAAPLLHVLQDTKWQILNARYTVVTPDGQPIARFRKNFLYNLIRKRWYILAPDGVTMLAVAKEDSIILSLLRRLIGGIIGAMIRTNFIILQGTTDRILGEFNRKFTILDRYVLDMSADPAHELDRRICLALGVMLDTGERR
jgi:uncharacterized protein YxjI